MWTLLNCTYSQSFCSQSTVLCWSFSRTIPVILFQITKYLWKCDVVKWSELTWSHQHMKTEISCSIQSWCHICDCRVETWCDKIRQHFGQRCDVAAVDRRTWWKLVVGWVRRLWMCDVQAKMRRWVNVWCDVNSCRSWQLCSWLIIQSDSYWDKHGLSLSVWGEFRSLMHQKFSEVVSAASTHQDNFDNKSDCDGFSLCNKFQVSAGVFFLIRINLWIIFFILKEENLMDNL